MVVRTTRNEFQGGAVSTFLTASLTAGATSFTLVSGTGYPTGGANGNFVVVIGRGTATEEKILCSSRTGATFTVAASGRGYDGTTAVAHTTSEAVEHCIDSNTLDSHETHMFDTTRDDHTQYHNNTRGDARYPLSSLLTTRGDLFARGAAAIQRLALGAANRVLRSDGTDAVWGQIVAADITNDTITAAQIAPNAIGSSELADGAVDTAAIVDANVTAAKLEAAIPLGTLGYAQVTADQTGLAPGPTDLTSLTVTVPVGTGRRIRVTGRCQLEGNAANNALQLLIREGGTTLSNNGIHSVAVSESDTVTGQVILTPSAGAHTYKLSAARGSGAGTLAMRASATFPAFILVEDIGV